MGPRKRQLHEQPYTEIVKSGTIRIASFLCMYSTVYNVCIYCTQYTADAEI